jgi:hypothetical protein
MSDVALHRRTDFDERVPLDLQRRRTQREAPRLSQVHAAFEASGVGALKLASFRNQQKPAQGGIN